MPAALCLSNVLGSGSGLGGASWMCVCVSVCVYSSGGVLMSFYRTEGVFFFFFRGRDEFCPAFFPP